MVSLPSPVGALSAARSFFTPPTVTPVNGPASWFAAQRPAEADAAPRTRPRAATSAFGNDAEAFDLEPGTDLDADLDAFERRSVGA